MFCINALHPHCVLVFDLDLLSIDLLKWTSVEPGIEEFKNVNEGQNQLYFFSH